MFSFSGVFNFLFYVSLIIVPLASAKVKKHVEGIQLKRKGNKTQSHCALDHGRNKNPSAIIRHVLNEWRGTISRLGSDIEGI